MKTKTTMLALLLMAATATQSVGQGGTVFGELGWATTNVTTPGNFATRPDMYTQFYRWNRDIAWAATGYFHYTTWLETAEPSWTVNPCPTGWRIPTQAEFESLQRSGYTWAHANTRNNAVPGMFLGTNHATAAIGNMQGCVFLPALGIRNHLNGAINSFGIGNYWSTTSNGADHATVFRIASSYINPIAFEKVVSANTIRCVQEPTGAGNGTIIDGVKWANTNVAQPGYFAASADMPTEFYQWNSDRAWAATGSVDLTEWKAATEQEWTVNVCPTGWRLPTATEFQSLVNSGSTHASATIKGNAVAGMFFGTNHATCSLPDKMAGCIFLPVSGFLVGSVGSLVDQGNRGSYWSSTQSPELESGYTQYLSTSLILVDNSFNKAMGANIRCVHTVPTTSINGLKWANTNLTTPGVFAERADMFTEFYQWSKDTAWAATGNLPAGTWNTTAITTTEWTDDPCPQGWRLPTQAEFQDLLATADYEIAYPEYGRGNEVTGFFFGENASTCTLPNNMAGCIFLPASGGRNYSLGRLSGQDGYGYYWSSSQSNANGHALSFSDMTMQPNMVSANKKSGYNIRCVSTANTTSAATTQRAYTFNLAQAENYDVSPKFSSATDTVKTMNRVAISSITQTKVSESAYATQNLERTAEFAAATLYPNPVVNGELTIDNGELAIGVVEVLNNSGAVVRTQDFGSQTTGMLQLQGLQGSYFIRIGKTTQSIVVAK